MVLSDWLTLVIAFCSVVAVPMVIWGGSSIQTLKTQAAVLKDWTESHEQIDDVRFTQIKQTLDRLEAQGVRSEQKLDRAIERIG